jgi:hypothetical protein
MTNSVATRGDPALQPVAAANQAPTAGSDALRKALDKDALEGRDAVQDVKETAAGQAPAQAGDDAKGRQLDRTA